MEKVFYLNELYDLYKELLTSKQQEYFEDYYFDNLSLSEMAERYQISRNGVYSQLKLIEKKLENYEEKLGLRKKREQILGLVDEKTQEKIMNIW